MWENIKSYALLWNPFKGKGLVKLILSDESEHKVVMRSTREFRVIADLLRHEQYAVYNKKTGSIATGWQARPEYEPTGGMPETGPVSSFFDEITFEDRDDYLLDKDDLKQIAGIGEVIEQKLNALGIFTYRQIANWTDSDIDEICSRIEYLSDRIQRDNWLETARELHSEKYGEAP